MYTRMFKKTFCILLYSRDRRECFKQFQTFSSVPRIEKHRQEISVSNSITTIYVPEQSKQCTFIP